MQRGQWIVATLYEANGRKIATEKGYWTRATAESHFNNMRGKVIHVVLYDPNGNPIKDHRKAKDESDN